MMFRLSRDRRGIIGAIIAVVVIVIIIIAVLALIVIPFREVKVNEARQASLGTGVEAVDLTFSTDLGAVEVRFVDDPSIAVALTVTGNQRSGLLGSSQPVNVSWEESTNGNTLNVTSVVKIGGKTGLFSNNNINSTLLISNKLRTGLSIDNSLGGVDVQAGSGIELTSVHLRTSTGGSKLTMAANSTLSGPLSMEASLGGVDLSWTDVNVTGNASVDLKASTGGVKAAFSQSEPLASNISITTSANVGGVDLALFISGNNSARVLSHTNLGGVNVVEQTGFNGTSADLTSQNYPTSSNFAVSCDTNTGGVNLRLRYTA
jgi:hypothetical protein